MCRFSDSQAKDSLTTAHTHRHRDDCLLFLLEIVVVTAAGGELREKRAGKAKHKKLHIAIIMQSEGLAH